jgi:hypothetical protein
MAGGLVGAKTNATQEPQILGVQVTTSLYNQAIPLLIGKRRAAGHVIWYGDFGPSGGSGKKGKSGKKGGPTSYQANLDLLIAFGPIWAIQSIWQNSSIVGYGSGLSSFSQAGSQTFTITAASTFSGTVNNQPGGYNLDFISAISFTPSTPVSATIDDYGDPLGSRTITETETEQWLYNTYENFSSSGLGSIAWRPGSWEFGKPYCNAPSCSFPIGVDHGGADFTCTFPEAVTGTITVYWGATKADHDNPLTYINYEFEAELGSGNEFSSTPSQQIIYPELSGVGGVAIDLGISGTAPELDVEAQGLYSLDKNGQVNPADLILDLILSGNAYHNNLNGTWTPFCFSHGLNFGGDPSRETFQGFDPGFPGSLTWPPVCSFPWVLPMPSGGAASGSQFQILRDPPTFNQGPFSGSSAPYSANSIVEGSDSNFYRALTYADADPVSGGSTTWAQFDGDFSDGLEDVRNYCAANGIFISTYINSQKACSDILNEVCEISNCVPVWNGQSLDFYPLSEVSQVGGGVVYTPRTASGPIVVLDSNYFEMEKDEAPVTVKQENMQSVCNILDINYSDAAFDSDGMCGYQAYQSTSVRISDAEHCGLYGPMNGSPRGYDDYICDATTATKVGWPIMKRQRFADTYAVDFKLPQTVGSLLDPMDLITVNDPLFGGVLTTGVATTGPIGQDVRISELSEDKDGVWTLSCERFMYGMSAPQAPSTAGTVSNPPPSVSAPAGNVNTPYFFEPTAALAVALGMTSEGGLAIAVSGSATNYGGCVVNVSTDGGSSYSAIGRLPGNSTMGYTTADYPLSPNPDASDTLAVDLTESEGELVSYTSGQQAQLIPIALVDNGGTPASGSAAGYTTEIPYEIVAYETVSLVSTYNYDLSPTILRGQLGTVPADHPYGGSPAEGSAFVDLSNPNSVFKTSVPSGNIVGNTLYFKFQTFNQYGAAIQDISDCTAYSFALTGATNPTSPNSPGGSYTLTPSPLLYQGKTGGWPGVDGSSTSWTNPDYVYWPSFSANFASGAVDYAANDSGTSAFTGSGQTVYVTIYDPSRSGSGTVHVDSTNANATTPGYVYLGQITSSAAGNSGGTGGSSGSGGPQDPGSTGTWDITVDGAPIV